ncbi:MULTISPECIES: hypothetical protein [Flavobacteriaceae]|uniref:hypothetical protein n=1 Tax=Flavobacteriaceae TaxID=49546 RepID=UPI001493196B|nr:MULTISPECIES: hypothetical protein [Allomuricauda]MDC6365712.1 hypothetical protein [Muricauda sp. AC10]
MKQRNLIMAMLVGTMMVTITKANEKEMSLEEFDINKVEFIEDDQSLDLGFDTAEYLPENFDPYQGKFSVSAINFIDECEEIELGFETMEFLPSDFDPYTS